MKFDGFLNFAGMREDAIGLYELQRLIREGIEEVLPGRVWVRAEIASVQARANGHCYMELCHSENGRVIAKARAVIWRNIYGPLSIYFRESAGEELKAGMEILAGVQVTYNELYGLSLTIYEIEPAFTIGASELEKRKTIGKLTEEGMMDRQQALTLPLLPRRLAVISARDAAGYGDFCRHLLENEYGFAFSVSLFEAAMQGKGAPGSICEALAAAETSEEKFDAVLILRGGGSSLDLACFDDYGLCYRIAACTLPVVTAIGHDRDYHVADMVAFDHCKTPTALADMFIDAVAAEDARLTDFGTRLRLAFSSRLASMNSALDLLETRIRAADPRNVLSKGYTLVADASGHILKSVSSVRQGDILKVLFNDGSIEAVANKVSGSY